MRLVLRLYPRPFRDRYGDEISLLLASSPTPARDLLNVFWHALIDRTESAMSLTWRRAPRFLLVGALWLLAAYTFRFVNQLANQWILSAVLEHTPAPVFTDHVARTRLITALCVVAVAGVTFMAGRLWWRSSVWLPIVALATVTIIASVVQLETHTLTAVGVQLRWNQLGWVLAEQALWAAAALALVVAIRKVGARWVGLVAGFGVIAVPYAISVLVTFVLRLVYGYQDNPWTAYWEGIVHAVTIVRFGQDTGIVMHVGGWSTLTTAFVVGCALAVRSRKTSVLGRPYAV